MTDMNSVPQDDFLDVLEMTQKIEAAVYEILEDIDHNLATSALISASINCLVAQCDTLEDMFFHRNLFTQMFDKTIRSARIQGPDNTTAN